MNLPNPIQFQGVRIERWYLKKNEQRDLITPNGTTTHTRTVFGLPRYTLRLTGASLPQDSIRFISAEIPGSDNPLKADIRVTPQQEKVLTELSKAITALPSAETPGQNPPLHLIHPLLETLSEIFNKDFPKYFSRCLKPLRESIEPHVEGTDPAAIWELKRVIVPEMQLVLSRLHAQPSLFTLIQGQQAPSVTTIDHFMNNIKGFFGTKPTHKGPFLAATVIAKPEEDRIYPFIITDLPTASSHG